MTRTAQPSQVRILRPRTALLLILGAVAGYGFAFALPQGAAGILLALPCLFQLAFLPDSRWTFYGGLLTGMAMYVPHLLFFGSIFGLAAFPLWLIAGLPVGVFLLLLHGVHRRLGHGWATCLTPVLWTGVEYFRSELWYLRFAWLIPGQAAAFLPGVRIMALGVYGVGFIYALAAALVIARPTGLRIAGVSLTLVLAALMYWPTVTPASSPSPLRIAGMQMEFPDANALPRAIDRLATAHPEAQILVLSEYTFLSDPPPAVRDMVRKHGRYLVVGGIQTLPDGHYFNTAFVIGPDGRDVFSQAKSVPVQFMSDGLPATSRHVWESPWGKIGIAVCYDVSYGRVMDDFVRQGAQGLIVPTMDLTQWGEYERRMLHGRLATIRSAEYGIPTFGVWSSGVSQLTDRSGKVIAAGEYPGQGDMISGPFDLGRAGRVPPDRFFALCTTLATGIMIAYLFGVSLKERGTKQRAAEASTRDDG